MNLRNLILSLCLVCAVALAATWYGSHIFKRKILEQEAVGDAVRWALFIASQSPEINAELASGRLSKRTYNTLDIASSAGGVFRYKLFDSSGIIIHASRLGDIGERNTKPYFEKFVRNGQTFAKIESDEKFGRDRTVVSEAYVPLMEDGRFAGAIEVYVDETDTAAMLDQVAKYAFLGVALLLIIVAISWMLFVWRDLKIQLHVEKKLKDSAEELLQALGKEKKLNKLQREFVSMASHEFRTPLAIIDATAQRMKSQANKNELTPEKAVIRVEKIRDAVGRMTRLMESTLDAARMEEGKIELKIEPCDIGRVVREVCARQQDISQTHVISCDLAGLPETIQADTGSVEQVLTNLCANAVKYAPDAPDIEIKARTEGGQVVISLRDHGIGIDEDDLDRIGERFFRARTSTGIAGTGIGLNLAKTLVEMHGGMLKVESRKGEGSTFTIRLPIEGPDHLMLAEKRVA